MAVSPQGFWFIDFQKSDLSWSGESRGAIQRSTTGIKRRKGQRETERREEEKIKNGAEEDTMTNTENRITKLHLLLAKALLSFQRQRVGPTWRSSLPRSCGPWLHHLPWDLADKVNQPVTWCGLTKDTFQLRYPTQSEFPSPPEQKESPSLRPFWFFPFTYFFMWWNIKLHH